MSVEPTQYGTWRARWRDLDGKPRAKSFRTRSQADRYERRMRTDTEDGKPTAPRRGKSITVRAWAEEWLTSSHNLSPGSVELYRQDLDLYILPALGDHSLAKLENHPELIDDFLSGQIATGRAPASVHRYWRTMRRMFNVAMKRRKIARSPIIDVEAPRVPKTEMRFLDVDPLQALAAAANGPTLCPDADEPPEWDYADLIETAGWGGLRWGECAGLRRRWVDRDQSGVYVMAQWTGTRFEETKGRNQRFVSLHSSLVERLDQPGPPDELVFSMPRGGPLDHSNWRERVWVPAKRQAGVDPLFRFQDLRHTAVALAIKAGLHPEAIKRRFGWSTIALLDVYGHLLPGVDDLSERLERMRAETRKSGLKAV